MENIKIPQEKKQFVKGFIYGSAATAFVVLILHTFFGLKGIKK
jgi:hypothetical protein